MPRNCDKCGREYVTGADDIPEAENEYTVVEVHFSMHLRGGYKSMKVNDEYFEDKDLCPECGKEVYDLMHKTYRDWLYKKE